MIMSLATLSCQLKGIEYTDIPKRLVQQLDVMQLEQVKDQYITSFHSQDQMMVYYVKLAWESIILSLSASSFCQMKSGLSRCLLVSQDI